MSTHQSHWRRLAAILILASATIGDDAVDWWVNHSDKGKAIKGLRRLLKDGDPAVRVKAACVIASKREEPADANIEAALSRAADEALQVLRAELKRDDDFPVRIEAALGLAKWPNEIKRTLATLREGLSHENEYIRWQFGSALAELGEPGLHVLLEETQRGRHPGRSAAIQGLIEAERDHGLALPSDLMSSLVAILGTSTSSKDLHGALWLASQESNRARACAPAALGHLHNGPRTLAALEVLKAAGPDKAFLEPLRKYLHDNAIEYGTVDEGGIEYELAASILGRQGPAGVRIVLDRLADIEDYYARKLSWGLGEHLDEIFPTLLEATKSPNSGTRRRVIKLLAKTKDKKRLRAVYDAALPLALNDPDAGVREEAAHQLRWLIRDLGEIPQEETLRKAAVEHADENVRLGAMYALGEINLPTVEFLIDRLTDSAERVRVIATHGLAQHGPAAAKAVPSILERLDKGDPPSPCMGALAHIAPDDPRTVEAIVGQLAAKVPQHVQLAIRWLIYLGPKGRTAEKRLRDLPKADAMEDRLYRLHALWKMTDEDADRLAFVDELRPLLQRIETFETWMDARHVTWAVKELGAGARELLPSIDRALQKNINSDNRKNLSDARAAIVGAK